MASAILLAANDGAVPVVHPDGNIHMISKTCSEILVEYRRMNKRQQADCLKVIPAMVAGRFNYTIA